MRGGSNKFFVSSFYLFVLVIDAVLLLLSENLILSGFWVGDLINHGTSVADVQLGKVGAQCGEVNCTLIC